MTSDDKQIEYIYDPAARLAEFRALRSRGALCTAVTEQLATEAATEFLKCFGNSGEYLSEAITLLAEISTLEEPCLSEPGRLATFPLLIERLSDSFNPKLCSVYDRVFLQMISICRKLPGGARLDAALRDFGIANEQEMLARKAGLREPTPMLGPIEREKVRKALVLSRVTLGADVAVSSVVLQKAKRRFPNAEVILLGSAKLKQLFGGDRSIRIHEVRYRSDGGLLVRLQSWFPVIEAVEQETRQLRPEQFVLLDPDSRLLQLGLLPALRDDWRYFFLESRAFCDNGQGSMSRIAREWMERMFGDAGEDGEVLPYVSLREQDKVFGEQLRRKLLAGGSQFIVAASFGVGGNQEKRLPDPFEQGLLSHLFQSGSTVLLDSGAGAEEIARAQMLARNVEERGRRVIYADARNAVELMSSDTLGCDVLIWQGEIGAFAGLIGASEEYIGYDSSGQHIAAALGTPTIDIFTRPPSPVFQERWTPTGRAPVYVITQTPFDEPPLEPAEVLSRITTLHNCIRGPKEQSVDDAQRRK
ncbi:MAG: glycosyltransferase family 9 protein [Acidobacteria bacterium]|nr:glycosyltransferase family 9 protein [Acidobacteriota bacterium]